MRTTRLCEVVRIVTAGHFPNLVGWVRFQRSVQRLDISFRKARFVLVGLQGSHHLLVRRLMLPGWRKVLSHPCLSPTQAILCTLARQDLRIAECPSSGSGRLNSRSERHVPTVQLLDRPLAAPRVWLPRKT